MLQAQVVNESGLDVIGEAHARDLFYDCAQHNAISRGISAAVARRVGKGQLAEEGQHIGAVADMLITEPGGFKKVVHTRGMGQELVDGDGVAAGQAFYVHPHRIGEVQLPFPDKTGNCRAREYFGGGREAEAGIWGIFHLTLSVGPAIAFGKEDAGAVCYQDGTGKLVAGGLGGQDTVYGRNLPGLGAGGKGAQGKKHDAGGHETLDERR